MTRVRGNHPGLQTNKGDNESHRPEPGVFREPCKHVVFAEIRVSHGWHRIFAEF